MAITKEDLRERILDVKQGWFDSINSYYGNTNFERMIEQCISKLDLEKLDDDYTPAYVVFAAIAEKYAESVIKGSCDRIKIARYNREKNKLKKKIDVVQ